MMMNMMIYLALKYKMVIFLDIPPCFMGGSVKKTTSQSVKSSVGASWFLNLAEMESTGLCLSCPCFHSHSMSYRYPFIARWFSWKI